MDFLSVLKKVIIIIQKQQNKRYIMAKLQYTYTIDTLKQQDALYKTHPGNSCRNMGDMEV